MSVENQQPIGTYREISPFAKREFVLFANKVTIRGTRLAGDYVHHIPLEQLSPDVGTQTLTRGKPIYVIWMVIIICALIAVGVMEKGAPQPWIPVWARAVLMVGGLALSLAGFTLNRRKFPSYHFFNTHGVMVLDIIEAGPEKANCKAFAELISQTIKNLRGL